MGKSFVELRQRVNLNIVISQIKSCYQPCLYAIRLQSKVSKSMAKYPLAEQLSDGVCVGVLKENMPAFRNS